jgi:hypothetical protein
VIKGLRLFRRPFFFFPTIRTRLSTTTGSLYVPLVDDQAVAGIGAVDRLVDRVVLLGPDVNRPGPRRARE